MLAEGKERGERDGGKGGDRKSRSQDVTVKPPTLDEIGISKVQPPAISQSQRQSQLLAQAEARQRQGTRSDLTSPSIEGEVDFGESAKKAAESATTCNLSISAPIPTTCTSYLRGKRFNSEKKPHGGDRKSSYQNDILIGEDQRTNERIAEEYHVSPATISRDAKFAEAVDALAECNHLQSLNLSANPNYLHSGAFC